jgi:hypothetical protein
MVLSGGMIKTAEDDAGALGAHTRAELAAETWCLQPCRADAIFNREMHSQDAAA